MPTRNNRAISVCLIGLLFLSIALFESTPRAQENSGAESSTPAELVTDYLQRDVFLRPGVGLKKVRLGMKFDDVLRAWGRPTSATRGDVSGTRWTYRIAEHTTITLIGIGTVKTMRIAGAFNSPYVTTEGASFGMAQHQLASIYGPTGSDSGEINYNRRGIAFVLDQGQVSEMRVFSRN
jgi:hypothetical protein